LAGEADLGDADDFAEEPEKTGEPAKKPPKKPPDKRVHYLQSGDDDLIDELSDADLVAMVGLEQAVMQKKEWLKLISEFGYKFVMQCVEKLHAYKGSNGKKYKSDYLAIRNWVVEEVQKSNHFAELRNNQKR
jgi:hypothetical protein